MRPRSMGGLAPALLALVALVALFAPPADAAPDHPNFVIIFVDDMGYGDTGSFNPDSKIPTPHIDRLADEGMRFTDAHAPGPLCHMSRYGLLTGEYPFRVDVTGWRERPLIGEGRTTIASMLREQGYATHMVGKWHLGFQEDGYDKPLPGGPVDRGFDSYFGIRASTDIPPYFYIHNRWAVEQPTAHIGDNLSGVWPHPQGAFWREGGIAPNLDLADVLPRFTEEAIEVIHEQDAKQPFLLYLSYPAPHTPWLPSDDYEDASAAGMYGDFMVMVDAMVGRVVAKLEQQGHLENSLIFFTSDNGPYWLKRDVAKFGHDSAGGLRGMKGDAWEGGHRMPFIARWPGKVAPGSTSEQMLCFTDFLATFADLTDASLPDGEGPDSVSFLPALLGTEPGDTAPRQEMAIPSGRGVLSVRSGDWKLIEAPDGGGLWGESVEMRNNPAPDAPAGQLYNLADDLGEQNNLYDERPEKVEELTAVRRHIVSTPQTRP